ncbi:MAG TPA: HEAT repeat domain-containing protein [Candidatus Wallbacteria bacterium]|nr:MAG: hypothetical protein BWY32_01086 [bacterium ADurb.Bin243]HPG57803.1 HEAT repeat domain-containing protein [Candidatus Wallbacteria bacterium]
MASASDQILSIKIPVLAAQAAAFAAGAFSGAPFLFIIFQAAIACAIYLNYKSGISKNDLPDFYYYISIIFSLPFICFYMIKKTVKLVSTAAAEERPNSTVTEDIKKHIKADWDSYAEFKTPVYGHSSLASNAVPIVDLLSGEDIEIKRKSIIILHKLKTVKSIALLKKALSDANVEIKFMAASALLNIENDFKERIKNLEEEIARAEEENYPALQELRYNLAAVISKYLMSGLLDNIGQKKLGELMHYHLNSAIAENKNYIEALALLAGEYFKKAMYKEALEIVENALKNPALSGCSEDVKISLVTLLCEIHYACRDIDKLGRACASIKNYLNAEVLKKRPELIDFEKSVKYFAEAGAMKGGTVNG